MTLLNEIYSKSIAGSEKDIRFWEQYLQDLKAIDFSAFAEKLKVPCLVPIGSRILFRGELKHTNEVTVALGADYFVKCSLKQAEELRQHRIKDAKGKLEAFNKQKEFLENRVSFFGAKSGIKDEGQEIIEVYTEDEDRAWREKHRENVKKHKQSESKERIINEEINDEDLWMKLEELELQEELRNELSTYEQDNENKFDKESFVVKDDLSFNNSRAIKSGRNRSDHSDLSEQSKSKVTFKEENNGDEIDAKHKLLLKVIDKQNELEEKLLELKNKERTQSKTEEDLLKKLDEMEELDELEDEMDRLDDIIETEDNQLQSDEDTSTSENSKLNRKVSFADEDEPETLELTFHHSDVEPCKENYDPTKGIQKPSDIYEAYPNMFTEQTTSILKKSKYGDLVPDTTLVVEKKRDEEPSDAVPVERETILIKDVLEKVDQSENQSGEAKRPVSLFKKKRQQMKS